MTPPEVSAADDAGEHGAPLLQVGFVARAHGIVGDVLVRLTTDRIERVEPGSVLTGESERFGEPLDLRVERSRPHKGGWIVRFEGWATRDGAEMLTGTSLHAAPLDDPDTVWVHDLIGRRVVDQGGRDRGPVVSVEANPASDLLVLESGALVPARFVHGIDGESIRVEVPEGLFPE